MPTAKSSCLQRSAAISQVLVQVPGIKPFLVCAGSIWGILTVRLRPTRCQQFGASLKGHLKRCDGAEL